MKKINLSVTGCMGRMGQQIIKSSNKRKEFKLVSLTESKVINKKILGIKISLNDISSFKKTDVIIDFTAPRCTFEVLKIALTKNLKRVEWVEVEQLSKNKTKEESKAPIN